VAVASEAVVKLYPGRKACEEGARDAAERMEEVVVDGVSQGLVIAISPACGMEMELRVRNIPLRPAQPPMHTLPPSATNTPTLVQQSSCDHVVSSVVCRILPGTNGSASGGFILPRRRYPRPTGINDDRSELV